MKNKTEFPFNLLDKNGKIVPEFWKPRKNLTGFQTSLKIIQNEKFLSLIHVLPYSIAPSDYDHGLSDFSPEVISALKQLTKMGFNVRGGHNNFFNLNKQFFVWYLGDDFGGPTYLIDRQKPTKAYCFDYLHISYLDKKPVLIQQMDDGILRLFFKEVVNNGREAGLRKLYIFDIDPKNGSARVVIGSYFLDMYEKKTDVIVFEDELAIGFYWFWIYKWDGKVWKDCSSEYPDFYKTTVYSEWEKWAYPSEWDKAVKALRQAALKGGPSAFITNGLKK